MSKKSVFSIIIIIIGLIISWSWIQHPKQPLRIGFVADLGSELGTAGRDGSLLAVEEINSNGGIHGHQVELVMQNNGNDQQQAWDAVQKLIDQDVLAIVGHMTSEMSYSTHELVDQAGIVMISPTNSTDLLSHHDDNFLRVYPAASAVTGKLARYALRRDLKRFAILYDQSNHAYSASWSDSFKKDFTALGGQVNEVIPFDGKNLQTSFLALAKQINDACVDGVLILAKPMDTAMISQQFNKLGCNIRLFATEWSASPTLYSFGGKTVEDLIIIQTYLPEALDPKSLLFKERLHNRFNRQASFASAHAYDTTRMLLAALERNEDRAELKHTLLSFGAFEGVQSPIILDENGDAERIFFIRQITDGKISMLAQL